MHLLKRLHCKSQIACDWFCFDFSYFKTRYNKTRKFCP
uniref:Uncharacterized protein n=1 Tax=Anguilla anguilla TaxID=7936 RepID=A0A0E9UF15_ANGAN